MAKLIIARAGGGPSYFHLDKERLLLGREETCDLRLDDRDVSRRHAMIFRLGNDDILEDMGSANGTLLNGQRISRHILQDHDQIQIGPFQIEYVNQRALKDMDFEKTMMVDRNMLSAALAGGYAQRDAAPVVTTTRDTRAKCQDARLLVMDGNEAGKHLELTSLVTPLGRRNGLTPAAVLRRPQGYMLFRVAGPTQVRVNQKGIGEAWKMLEENDVIEVDGLRYGFNYR